MDIIKLTRELGKAIQADERYAKFVAARETNEKDDELNELIGKMQLIHMSYQHEASKEDANEQKLTAYEEE
ncbi:MAG: YlbF family regulator, partial [Clostridia bacterium]|nr:YlbF family regulator [Clostridia bacterium]